MSKLEFKVLLNKYKKLFDRLGDVLSKEQTLNGQVYFTTRTQGHKKGLCFCALMVKQNLKLFILFFILSLAQR